MLFRGAPAFRYDNAPHHPHLSTYPHHKHLGNELLPALEPNLVQVIAEAQLWAAQHSSP